MPAPGAAVQRIPVTAWVTVVPPSVTGGSSGAWLVAIAQPGVGSTLTESSGFSVGSCTRSEIVEAVGLSLGTRKVISPNPPAVAPVELTVTRAEAGPMPSARTAAVTASSARIAREGRAITEGFSCAGPGRVLRRRAAHGWVGGAAARCTSMHSAALHGTETAATARFPTGEYLQLGSP